MPTHVRSYSKINLGLAIGPTRPDGFHGLCTLYQTLALYDVLSVVARPARQTLITLRSNDRRVPLDARNTVWKTVERVLAHTHRTAEVTVHIQKNLPIQGGMGAGSANAAAALIGLERQLNLHLAEADRLRLASEVGSDVPLFLLGGAVLGTDRGQIVAPAPAITLGGSDEISCVVALPGIGVSTPQAFRDWDARLAASGQAFNPDSELHLHNPAIGGTIEKLSQTYASVFPQVKQTPTADTSVVTSAPGSSDTETSPENLQGISREQLHASPEAWGDREGSRYDLAETLLALVRTGIENDFEKVVFAQYPALQTTKRTMMGSSDSESSAVYAALSGSGSAVFGLFCTEAHAQAAQQRLQQDGVEALVTKTLPRSLYWSTMFAE